MDAKECIMTRRSVRSFTSDPVHQSDIEQILELAKYAPSWKNSQTVRYTLILDSELKREISDNCLMDFKFNQGIVNYAPAIVVLSTVKSISGFEKDGRFSTSKGTHWESFYAGIAAQTFCLAAHENGFGTVIMGVYDEGKVSKAVNIPENQSVSALIAIGRPAKEANPPARLAVSDLLTVK